VVCAPEAERLVARERAAFLQLYPGGRIGMRTGTSREAVRALFAAECDLAVITRELDVEERAAAVRGRLELEGYRFARDAVVPIVHPSNPVQNIAIEQLRRIYDGTLTSWSELGGRPEPIEPVIQPMESDISQFFLQQVMGGAPITARVFTEASNERVAARVLAERRAIGYTSIATADSGVKALAVASVLGLPYFKPDAEAVYQGSYPMTRFFNLYVRAGGAQLGNDFITFVTSRDGQALVHNYGLVPTAVPVRFVRRSPMLGTH